MAVRIALVDDHAIVRDGLRLRLQQEPDFTVVAEAGDSREAVACAEKSEPDLMLVDLSLPEEGGIAAIKGILAVRPGIKILVLTGVTRPEDTQEAFRAGAHGFLRKEDASEDLVQAIRTVIAGKVYISPHAATALTRALQEQQRKPPEPALNDRELAFLKGLANGKSYKEIADGMNLSVKSVENYRAQLAKKLGCSTRAELVRYAVRTGIVSA